MTTPVQFSIKLSTFSILHTEIYKKPINYYSLPATFFASCTPKRFNLRAYKDMFSFVGGGWGKDGIWVKDEGLKGKRRVVLVRFNQGFGFNGGVGGGGGIDNGETAGLLGNIALAIGLTYLSVTGQLGWIFDAIVSIWLVAVLVPIVGLGAFIWWAGRDRVQGTCPNCGNDFQIFKSSLNNDLQLCPFCTQPFSVEGNEFVRDSVKFSNQSTTFGQAFNDFYTSNKGDDSSKPVVDVEAEVKDVD